MGGERMGGERMGGERMGGERRGGESGGGWWRVDCWPIVQCVHINVHASEFPIADYSIP